MDTASALEWAHQRLIWRICLTPLHILGIFTAIYRIYRRYKTGQSGLDDYAATLTLIFDLIYFPTLWLANGSDQAASETPLIASDGDGIGANIDTRAVQVAISWLVQIVCPLLIWSAKTSLALTIARLIPPSQPTRRASIIVAYLSALIGIGILIQTCIFCSKVEKTWTLVLPYRCKVSVASGFIRFGAEVIIDICLVLIPFCTFFWPLPLPKHLVNVPNNNNPIPPVRLRLPATTLRLIKLCFTASLLTTSTVIVMVIVLAKTASSKSQEIKARVGYFAFVITHLSASVSLLACNLLIVVTSLYRVLHTQPRVVEAGISPVIPNLLDQVRPGLEPSSSSSGERVTTIGNSVSENSNPLSSGSGSGGRPTTRTASTPTSYNVELTELFESDLSIPEFQRSTA